MGLYNHPLVLWQSVKGGFNRVELRNGDFNRKCTCRRKAEFREPFGEGTKYAVSGAVDVLCDSCQSL